MKAGDTLLPEDTFLLYGECLKILLLTRIGTFGFPLDLTQIMCDEKGFKVDTDGFSKLLNEQREETSAVCCFKQIVVYPIGLCC